MVKQPEIQFCCDNFINLDLLAGKVFLYSHYKVVMVIKQSCIGSLVTSQLGTSLTLANDAMKVWTLLLSKII